MDETTLGEFLQAVESVRLRESRESMLVLGNSSKDGKELVELDKSKGQAAVGILPPVSVHPARREATSPSLRGSFSRYIDM